MTDTKRSGTSATARLAPVVDAFVAGAIGVLAFHQLTWWLLYVIGIIPDFSYKLKATAPLDVPQVLSQAFWGGLWGIVLALVLPRRGRVNYWVFAMAFGLIAPTLVGWFVVPLIKGTRLMGGPPWIIQVVRPIPNIAFGFGAALVLRLLPTSLVWEGLASENGQPGARRESRTAF